jgi:hypothetical protein
MKSHPPSYVARVIPDKCFICFFNLSKLLCAIHWWVSTHGLAAAASQHLDMMRRVTHLIICLMFRRPCRCPSTSCSIRMERSMWIRSYAYICSPCSITSRRQSHTRKSELVKLCSVLLLFLLCYKSYAERKAIVFH